MKITSLLILISIFYISCSKEAVEKSENPDDIAWGVKSIDVISSSYILPLNEYGAAVLTTITNTGEDITQKSAFYVNDQKIENNIFRPTATGIYKIHSKYKNRTSLPIEIKVEVPLNKKVLIEGFTSRLCVWCPWINLRRDSLHKSNSKVISYSIHGFDELEVTETQNFQEYLNVIGRPAVRVDRGYVRNFNVQTQIKGLIDSVYYFLSMQPKAEISIRSSLEQNNLSVNVLGKYYDKIDDTIYLTVVLVEDSVVTHNQYNGFSGHPDSGNPFISLPHPIPVYNNFNVLRRFLTDPRGQVIHDGDPVNNVSIDIGSFETQLDNMWNPSNSYIIAILHTRCKDIVKSSVLNSQIVKVGGVVDFNE